MHSQYHGSVPTAVAHSTIKIIYIHTLASLFHQGKCGRAWQGCTESDFSILLLNQQNSPLEHGFCSFIFNQTKDGQNPSFQVVRDLHKIPGASPQSSYGN